MLIRTALATSSSSGAIPRASLASRGSTSISRAVMSDAITWRRDLNPASASSSSLGSAARSANVCTPWSASSPRIQSSKASPLYIPFSIAMLTPLPRNGILSSQVSSSNWR